MILSAWQRTCGKNCLWKVDQLRFRKWAWCWDSLASSFWFRSIGVLTYVMLTGVSPFLGDSKQETFLNISRMNLNYSEEEFDVVSESAVDFIKALLVKEPEWVSVASFCVGTVCSGARRAPGPGGRENVDIKPDETFGFLDLLKEKQQKGKCFREMQTAFPYSCYLPSVLGRSKGLFRGALLKMLPVSIVGNGARLHANAFRGFPQESQ